MEVSLEALRGILFLGIIALLARIFVVQPFMVNGQSMEDSFDDKEYLLVDKLSYRLRAPQRGEVVILHPPQVPKENYIKRIVGLPGETIETQEGIVKINGQTLAEPYAKSDTEDIEPVKVALSPDEYFVMGDNRPQSSDSREIGPVPRVNLVGRAAVAVFPFQHFGFIYSAKY